MHSPACSKKSHLVQACMVQFWHSCKQNSSHSCATPFQVANFEYIDEEKAKEEARRKAAAEAANAARADYWEDLLKDKYDVQKVEEHTTMGKGKRSRKQVSL